MSQIAELRISIVIPAYHAAHHLRQVVPAARFAAGHGGEVVVVDPGSSDATSRVAEDLGARVIRLPERAGPAHARNTGAGAVSADVVLFVDSDCVVHGDVVKRVREAFTSDPRLVAVCGSYDAEPPDPGFASQYMNLRHHYTHQVSAGDGATFWAGCGAVRRSALLEAGGFDALRFPSPQIEDIELGLRLAKLGITRLDPELQVTHLKAWTLRQVIETDIRQRAIPWARLLLEQGNIPDNLNLRWSQRVAAALAPLALVSVVAAPLTVAAGKWGSLLLALLCICASLLCNWGMVRFFARRRGVRFAVGGWLFHQVHLAYSAATIAICWLSSLLRRISARLR